MKKYIWVLFIFMFYIACVTTTQAPVIHTEQTLIKFNADKSKIVWDRIITFLHIHNEFELSRQFYPDNIIDASKISYIIVSVEYAAGRPPENISIPLKMRIIISREREGNQFTLTIKYTSYIREKRNYNESKKKIITEDIEIMKRFIDELIYYARNGVLKKNI